MNKVFHNPTVTMERWQAVALVRIVMECRDPRWRGHEWLREIADSLGVDMTAADRLNPVEPMQWGATA